MGFRIASSNQSVLPRSPRVQERSHLQFIRALPCVICMTEGVDAAHIRYADARYLKMTGRGEKPDDRWTVPLCRRHHEAQHAMNEIAFWEAHGIDPHALALMLHHVSPNLDKGARIITAWNGWLK